MGRLPTKMDYENLRDSRILENQARLASLGIQKTASELRSVTTPVKSEKKKHTKVVYIASELRRSGRLKEIAGSSTPETAMRRRSGRLKEVVGNSTPETAKRGRSLVLLRGKEDDESEECLTSESDGEEEKRPANAPLLRIKASQIKPHSPEVSARRCDSKSRGSVYDPLFGICCHFCRQKKLCGEEDCERCGNLDIKKPCLGKTDCSVCHSTNGVLCRGCLKIRYGEEMEDVRNNKEWMCPHCIEEKGIKPFWICNSSFCLKKRKMAPTGIAIYRAREMGYDSVAHFLMDELRRRRG